jgi:hypothetical protein
VPSGPIGSAHYIQQRSDSAIGPSPRPPISVIGSTGGALGRRPEAVLHEGEAVAWWWQLTQLCPCEYDDRYRDAQLRFLRTFSLYDHDSGDLLTAELIARSQVQSYLEGAGDGQADTKSEALVEHRGRTSTSPARCHAVSAGAG